jgi:hypothetical protein
VIHFLTSCTFTHTHPRTRTTQFLFTMIMNACVCLYAVTTSVSPDGGAFVMPPSPVTIQYAAPDVFVCVATSDSVPAEPDCASCVGMSGFSLTLAPTERYVTVQTCLSATHKSIYVINVQYKEPCKYDTPPSFKCICSPEHSYCIPHQHRNTHSV